MLSPASYHGVTPYQMAPTASCKSERHSPQIQLANTSTQKMPVSILKKTESDASSTCSNSSLIRCHKGCNLKILNTHIREHNCIERLKKELNEAYLKISDLEEQLRLLSEGHHYKEQILRKQVKRLKTELGITPILDGNSPPITILLTREKGTFGFKLLGRRDGSKGEEGVVISSLTMGCPAEKSGKIYLWDKILKINDTNVSRSTCNEVETLIRNSPNSITLIVSRTPQSIPVTDLLPKTSALSPSGAIINCPSPYQKPPPPSPPPTNQPPLTTISASSKNGATVGTDPMRNPSKIPVLGTTTEPSKRISDEDFDNLSVIDLPDDVTQDKSSDLSDYSLGNESITKFSLSPSPTRGESPRKSGKTATIPNSGILNDTLYLKGNADNGSPSSVETQITDDATTDILSDAREYEEITLHKINGILGITLTYGTDTLQGALFVDSIRDNTPAAIAGKPMLHDQILKINGKEIGIDVMCDDAIHLLTDASPTVSLELARPKKHEIVIRRNPGESLGMMVAVSKVEEDKSVIISTVDPNGLVARYGLFKGLTLESVNGISLNGIGLKRAVETLASAVGEVSLIVFLHPNFSPYQPPRPPTPYPLRETGEGHVSAASYDDTEDDELMERSVKFSLPASPAHSATSTGNSVDSIPRDVVFPTPRYHTSPKSRSNEDLSRTPEKLRRRSGSFELTNLKGRSPNNSFDLNDPRNSVPKHFPIFKGYGSPSMNIINHDWSLDRSLTTETSSSPFKNYKPREQTRGPMRVSHQVIPSSILPMKVSLNSDISSPEHHHSPHHYNAPLKTPTPHHSLNQTFFNDHTPPPPQHRHHYQPIKTSHGVPLPSRTSHSSTPPVVPPRNDSLGNSPHKILPASLDSPVVVARPRVLGRRERAAMSGRKVQLGGFKPINPNENDDEHYV